MLARCSHEKCTCSCRNESETSTARELLGRNSLQTSHANGVPVLSRVLLRPASCLPLFLLSSLQSEDFHGLETFIKHRQPSHVVEFPACGIPGGSLSVR